MNDSNNIREVLPGIDSVELTGLYNGEEYGGSFSTSFGMGSIPGLSPYYWGSEQPLLGVVIQRNIRILQASGQPLEIFKKILNSFS